MESADLSRLQGSDRGADSREQIVGLFGAGADSAPVEEEPGPFEVERTEQLRGHKIGQRLGDGEFGLGEDGAIATGVLQNQRARRSRCGRAGAVIGRETSLGQRQLNSDTASEPSRRPFPHWAGRPPPTEGCRGPAYPAPSPARWAPAPSNNRI